RCGPLVLGFTRAPASRSIGCESSAIVGYARRYVSAMTCFEGLRIAAGSGGASNASTTSLGGVRERGAVGVWANCNEAKTQMKALASTRRNLRMGNLQNYGPSSKSADSIRVLTARELVNDVQRQRGRRDFRTNFARAELQRPTRRLNVHGCRKFFERKQLNRIVFLINGGLDHAEQRSI